MDTSGMGREKIVFLVFSSLTFFLADNKKWLADASSVHWSFRRSWWF